ncbi:MAG: hypothetical protein AAF153_01035 [Pseudomonadota bacterium]
MYATPIEDLLSYSYDFLYCAYNFWITNPGKVLLATYITTPIISLLIIGLMYRHLMSGAENGPQVSEEQTETTKQAEAVIARINNHLPQETVKQR